MTFELSENKWYLISQIQKDSSSFYSITSEIEGDFNINSSYFEHKQIFWRKSLQSLYYDEKTYYPNGQLASITKYHGRYDKHIVRYYENGQINSEEFYKNCKRLDEKNCNTGRVSKKVFYTTTGRKCLFRRSIHFEKIWDEYAKVHPKT